MQIGIVGLGRRGATMAERLAKEGHDVVAYDRERGAVDDVARRGAHGAGSLPELVDLLKPRRTVWLTLPPGDAVASTLNDILPRLSRADIVVDGSDSNFRDSMARARRCAEQAVHLLDIGTAGGHRDSSCLVVGGEREAIAAIEPILRSLVTPAGWVHAGPSGAGHFVKMVHNGIECALVQAYGEGFDLMAASPFGLDLAAIAELWAHGSVIQSRLLELTARALRADPRLEKVRGHLDDGSDGRLTVHEAIDAAVPAPTIALALFNRFRARQGDSLAGRLLAALRREADDQLARNG